MAALSGRIAHIVFPCLCFFSLPTFYKDLICDKVKTQKRDICVFMDITLTHFSFKGSNTNVVSDMSWF